MGAKKGNRLSTERVKALRERRAAKGYLRFEHYYRKENHKQVRDYVKRLNGKKQEK